MADRPRQVRLCAYPAYWLKEGDFANEALSEIEWSTGARIQPGDVQVFCIDDNLQDAEELANDPRVSAVHSLWEAVAKVDPKLGNEDWPVQAKFKLLVRLGNPVPKAELRSQGLLATRYQKWPQSQKGFIYHTPDRVRRLTEVLCRYNPRQAKAITIALLGKSWPPNKRQALEIDSEYSASAESIPEIMQVTEAIEVITGKRKAASGQGFQISSKIRRAVELKAMGLATAYFKNLGWRVENVSQRESYDLRCLKDIEELHVEVKGTTSNGSQVLLTPNEVEHAKLNRLNAVLVVVSHLQVNDMDADEPKVTGGEIKVFQPWLLNDNALKAVGYTYQIPQE
jgi:hypothetical protein